jgi:hypothetical protein
MPRPGDLTPEQAAAEGRRLRDRWREADRVAAGLYAEVCAINDASDEELDTLLPPAEAAEVREYRAYLKELEEDEWAEYDTSN